MNISILAGILLLLAPSQVATPVPGDSSFGGTESVSSAPVLVVDNGAKLYKRNCKKCHGKAADRNKGETPSLVGSDLNLEEKIQIVLEGYDMMPAFGEKLNQDQVKAIFGYIDSLPKD